MEVKKNSTQNITIKIQFFIVLVIYIFVPSVPADLCIAWVILLLSRTLK